MTKQEFLIQLQRELNGNIGSQNAASFVEYYQEYIEIELRKGHSIEEVMGGLGSPGLIARSITEVFRNKERKIFKSGRQGNYGIWLKDAAICLYQKIYKKVREWFDHL